MILSGQGIERESRIHLLKSTVIKIIEVYMLGKQAGSGMGRRATPGLWAVSLEAERLEESKKESGVAFQKEGAEGRSGEQRGEPRHKRSA